MIDTTVPGSGGWWLTRLASALGEDFPRLHTLRAHFEGTSPVADGGNTDLRDHYRRFRDLARLNVAELIVSAVVSRMSPTGFRTSTVGDTEGDGAAMARWTQNRMASQARDIFEDMALYGAGFALVDEAGGISRLSPWTTRVEAERGRPWVVRAALVAGWDDLEQADTLMVWWRGSDGRVWSRTALKHRREPGIPDTGVRWHPGRNWDWDGEAQLSPLSDVPVVPFVAKGGRGQFEPHLAALDRINHTIFQRLCITVMQAARQRWISGELPDLYPDGHPLAGQKIPWDDLLEGGPSAMWRLPPGTKVEESATTDVTPLLTAVKDELRQLAAASSTPLYLLDPEAAQGSAAGASASRETLVFKVEDLCARAGVALSQVMALSFEATGARRDDLEAIWAPADRPSLAERGQAASQAASTLPRKTIWREIWQLTPDEMAQAEQDEADDLFASASLGVDGEPA
jgi:hypothetical protein